MDISLISKYRTQLMGIAILWVMLFHSYLQTNSKLISVIGSMGYIGVDIFLFLSGFGVYRSLKKVSNYSSFLKKRFIRILPYYIAAIAFFSIITIHKIDFLDIFLKVTTIGYWINYLSFDWYIPTLLLFYTITPFIFKVITTNKYIIISLLFLLSIILFLIIRDTVYIYLIGTVARLPIYVTGIYLGYYSERKKIINIWPFFIAFTAFCSMWLYLNNIYNGDIWHRHGISLYCNYPIGVSICFVLSYFLSFFKNYKYPILTFFGTYTLTLYIFHERLMSYFWSYKLGSSYYKLSIFILTIILAVIWQKLIYYFINKIHSLIVHYKLKIN